MALIQRTRRPVTPAATPSPSRVVMRRPRPEPTTQKTEQDDNLHEINEQLQLIAKCEDEIDDASARLSEAHAKLTDLMTEARTTSYTNGKYVAEFVDTMSRASTVIDPKRFKANVADADFWKCITVSVTEARKVMTEKEIGQISKIEPAKKTGTTLKVQKVKVKVVRK